MTRSQNIFYNVLRNENATTELLCNLFRYQAFRQVVLTELVDRDFALAVEYDDVGTQDRKSDMGQADILIHNHDLAAIVEVKIGNADLTDNQPGGYLRRLEQQDVGKRALVFLIPEDYQHRTELERRIEKAPKPSFLVQIRTWQQVLSAIEREGLHEINPFISEFYNLLVSWYRHPNITFNRYQAELLAGQRKTQMTNLLVPDIIIKLNEVVDHVNSCIKGVSKSHSHNGEHGIYFKDKQNNLVLWFGMWYEFWTKHSQPLCIAIKNDRDKKMLDGFRTRHDGYIVDFEEWVVAFWDAEIYDDDDMAKKVAEKVEKELVELGLS